MGELFYGTLADWWPLISPVEDYGDEAAYFLSLLADDDRPPGPKRSVLELGSGGGNNAHFLAASFDLTLVDRSEAMLAVSRRLNPTAEHVCGDMRTIRLGRGFDVVFVHDAIDYMTTEHDLRAALETAHVHLKPGGTALVVPDHTAETFEFGTDAGGCDGDDGRAIRYLEWSSPPAPGDRVVTIEYAFVLRHPDGRVELAHETHHTGLFSRATWLRLLAEVGLDATIIEETTDEDRTPRDVFLAKRPAAAAGAARPEAPQDIG